MLRWLVTCAALCTGAYFLVAWLTGPAFVKGPEELSGPVPMKGSALVERGGMLDEMSIQVAEPGSQPSQTDQAQAIVIADSRLLVIEKQEVPSERDGKLLFLGTEIKPGETVREDQLIVEKLGFLAAEVEPGRYAPEETFTFPHLPGKLFRRWDETMPLVPDRVEVARETRRFRKLSVGDRVEKGDLVALVNPILAMDELAIKVREFSAKEADRRAAEKTREEAKARWEAAVRAARATNQSLDTDEIRGARLSYDRLIEEEQAKKAAVNRAERELNASLNILNMHEIRAMIPGVIKVIYKNRGDAVKQLEPIMQIQDTSRLRAEGLVGVEHARSLREGMPVTVEATQPASPRLALSGHLNEVTCVAVSQDEPPVILSGSTDRTLRGWDPATGQPLWRYGPHPAPVLAVACTPREASSSLALVGLGDGTVWLYDLGAIHDRALPTLLAERHRGAVSTVAFSPDGQLAATAGEDRSILIWDIASRKVLHQVEGAHRAAITCVHFPSSTQLVSAGRDNVLSMWGIDREHDPHKIMQLDRRGGEVAQLNSDGQRILFDQGKEMRIQSLDDRQIEGTLQNPPGGTSFSTLALFSPDGKTILTNGSGVGRLQLWRTPPLQGRGAEVRHLLWNSAITCGVFAPDSSFAVTGTQDSKVLVWSLPSKEEIEARLTGRVSLVERHLDSSTLQVRIWADLEESPPWLVPGATATMVVYPTRTADR